MSMMQCPKGRDGVCIKGPRNGEECAIAMHHDYQEGCNRPITGCPSCVPVAQPTAPSRCPAQGAPFDEPVEPVSDTPTPRTDAFAETSEARHDWGGCEDWCSKEFPCHSCQASSIEEAWAKFARQLERKLSEARAELAERERMKGGRG